MNHRSARRFCLSVREATGPCGCAFRPFCAMPWAGVAPSYPRRIADIQLLSQHCTRRAPRASKAWKRRILWRSTPTAAASCGARAARERGATTAIAGGHGCCRCVTPVVSGVDHRFPSSSTRCPAGSQKRGPRGAGSPSMLLCRHRLPRDSFRMGNDSFQYNHSKNNVNSDIISLCKNDDIIFIIGVAHNQLTYDPA
jgi:hypothetical protein